MATAGTPAFSTAAVARDTAGAQVPQQPTATKAASIPDSLTTSVKVLSVCSPHWRDLPDLTFTTSGHGNLCAINLESDSKRVPPLGNGICTRPNFFPFKSNSPLLELANCCVVGLPAGLTTSYMLLSL